MGFRTCFICRSLLQCRSSHARSAQIFCGWGWKSWYALNKSEVALNIWVCLNVYTKQITKWRLSLTFEVLRHNTKNYTRWPRATWNRAEGRLLDTPALVQIWLRIISLIIDYSPFIRSYPPSIFPIFGKLLRGPEKYSWEIYNPLHQSILHFKFQTFR